MKNCFLFALILVISLYTVSALYQGTINIGVGDDVELIVGDPPSFDVTNETCISGQTTCVGTEYYLCVNSQWVNQGEVIGYCGYNAGGTLGGGSTDDTGNILGFLETETNNFSNVSDTESISLNDDKGPEESIDGAPITGGVIAGIGNFAKSGAGALTLSVLVLTGAAVVIVLLRKKIGKKMFKEPEAESE